MKSRKTTTRHYHLRQTKRSGKVPVRQHPMNYWGVTAIPFKQRKRDLVSKPFTTLKRANSFKSMCIADNKRSRIGVIWKNPKVVRLKDSDRDGVPDVADCAPNDPTRQDKTITQHAIDGGFIPKGGRIGDMSKKQASKFGDYLLDKVGFKQAQILIRAQIKRPKNKRDGFFRRHSTKRKMEIAEAAIVVREGVRGMRFITKPGYHRAWEEMSASEMERLTKEGRLDQELLRLGKKYVL